MSVETPARTAESDTDTASSSGPRPATIAVRRSTLVTGLLLAIAVAISGTCLALWLSARGDLSDLRAAQATDRKAEQVATEYAVGAATINYQDANAWIGKLKANTTPQLAGKFDATAGKLQEILVPLKWTSTAVPIAARVAGSKGDLYTVDVFVNVTSASAQNPDGVQSTVTYNVTVDAADNWKITDVGGTGTALPGK